MKGFNGLVVVVLVLLCEQSYAFFPMFGAPAGQGPNQQRFFTSMMSGFPIPCDPFSRPSRPPPGGRLSQRNNMPPMGGQRPGVARPSPNGQAGGPVGRNGPNSMAPSFSSLLFGLNYDVPDAPDMPVMPIQGPGGRTTFTGCFCQELSFGSDCISFMTGNQANDPCMNYGQCCSCGDFGMWRR